MNASKTVEIVFSPVFRAIFHCPKQTLLLEKGEATLKDLLSRLSESSGGKIDPLIFEKGLGFISAGLMVKVNDRVYTGTMLNQNPVPLEDQDVVSLLYYVSGG